MYGFVFTAVLLVLILFLLWILLRVLLRFVILPWIFFKLIQFRLRTSMAPTWPAWGGGLLESDVDYDIANFIEADLGFNLLMYWRTKDGGLGQLRSRKELNNGLFDDLFERYRKCGPYYKRYGGKYFVVILVTLAMQVGANVSPEQLAHARSVYRTAGLFEGGIEQFEKALDNYKSGSSYEFGSLGLCEMMAEKQRQSKKHKKVVSYNYHALRYFDEEAGTSELARAIMDHDAPVACDYCGRSEPDLPERQKMKRCGKCQKEAYCNKDCQAKDWKVHKEACFTPAERKKRAAEGKGPGDTVVSLGMNGFTMGGIPHPV